MVSRILHGGEYTVAMLVVIRDKASNRWWMRVSNLWRRCTRVRNERASAGAQGG